MSNHIDRLKGNPFLTINKSHLQCPICNSDLYSENSWSVRDGNTVYHCEGDEQHKFWQNPREMGDVLHLNKSASETNFDSEKDYKWDGSSWSTT